MKLRNIYLFVFIICLMANACGDFGDTNIDPNNPATVAPGFLLTRAQKDIMDNTHDEWIGGRTTFFNAQYWAANNYTDESRYAPRQGAIGGAFSQLYITALNDLNEIIQINSTNTNKGEAANQIAIARILKAYTYQYMTDLWGPIPYFEALKGAANRTPKYDAQKAIYADLLKELKEATAQIVEGEKAFGDADIIYHSDLKAWKKFANSLMLRVAMRMSDVEPALAKAEIEKAASAAFSENSDNAYFTCLSGQPNNCRLNNDRVTRGDADFCISNVLIDNTLNPLKDPRVAAFSDKNANGNYKGRPYGQSFGVAAGEAPSIYSQPSGAAAVLAGNGFKIYDVLAPDAKATFMNYAEVCFILAEAKERGWNVAGTAQDWYNKGIIASMNEWGIDDAAAISAYLNQSTVKYSVVPGNWQQKIGVQKWIALYPQGLQGWSEWRRLDFDKLIAPVDGALSDLGNKAAPMRLTYPQEEQTKNSVNYQDAIRQLGNKDDLKTRLWWDIK